jgi:hypothetical protein
VAAGFLDLVGSSAEVRRSCEFPDEKVVLRYPRVLVASWGATKPRR